MWIRLFEPSLGHFSAAQQRKLAVLPAMKFGAGNALLSCSYSGGPAPVLRVSATQITQELLRTRGIQGLYTGLGATLMRWVSSKILSSLCFDIKDRHFISTCSWSWPFDHLISVIFTLQGHSLLYGLLSPLCSSESSRTAIRDGKSAILLVLHLRLYGRVYSCCGSKPLWWWVLLCSIYLSIYLSILYI